MANTPLTVDDVVAKAIELEASDIHVSANRKPIVRINGELHELPSSNLTDRSIATWLEKNIDVDGLEELESEGDIDFAISREDDSRIRVSAFLHQGAHALAMRVLQSTIPSFDDLALPTVMRGWPDRQTGLVIITGPTGSGKSTTLASLVNHANLSRASHIVTIEDPIEFVYPHALSIVQQREVGLDSSNFPRATRAALREDIDILVLGEMRDAETISAALAVAETGHLVFATLHTPSASHAIDRIIDAFEPAEQPLIRSRLSSSLLGIAYQRLLPAQGGGRLAAFEIIVGNTAIRNLIREGKTHQIPSLMVTGMAEGMRTMEYAIRHLVAEERISHEVAEKFLSRNI